jgi:hypothetical protein
MVNLEMVRTAGLGASFLGGPLPGPMSAQSIPLAGGDAGVAQTIRAMRRLIDQGKKDPTVHETAARIIRGANVPAFSWSGEVHAIYTWVLSNIRFTRDVYGKETLHAAPEILRLGIGDCDDFTILLCSLLGTIGHKTRILTIAKAEDERHFSHVFPQVWLDGKWVTIDAARRGAAIGRNPENVDRVRIWDTASDEFVEVSGMSGSSTLAGLNGAAGAHPSALPGAYPAWVADPRFRTLRGSTGIKGVGRYGSGEVLQVLNGMRANTTDPVRNADTPAGTDMPLAVPTRNDRSRQRMMSKLRFSAPNGITVDYSQGMGAFAGGARLGHWNRRKNAIGHRNTMGWLGDEGDGFDWGALTQAISAGTVGAANIISATRASPYNLFPTTGMAAQRPIVSGAIPGVASGSIGGISTGTLLLGGLGILAVAMFAGRR